MVDPLAVLDRLKVLSPSRGSAWKYLAPRSTGAVASGLVIALGSAALRRLIRSRRFGLLGGVAGATITFALWALSRGNEAAETERDPDEVGQMGTTDAREA